MRKLLVLSYCMLLLLSTAMAQTKLLSGKVTDPKGNPVANATILVKGFTAGTATKTDGSFSLQVPAEAKTLLVSAVGFTATEVNISGKSSVDIALLSDDKSMQEVIVTGYGTQKKAQLTGSVVKIAGSEVENIPMTSVDKMLQGKVAGLQSVSSNGQPGSTQAIRIRGIGSYSASSQPLFVVDGVQINSGDLSAANTTSNVLASFNPNDIEDINVLKDAAATSIYGARGANGVIIITTKKGKAGKTTFRFDTELGQTKYANVPDAGKPLRANDWFTMLKEGMVNAGYSDASITTTMNNYGYGNGVDVDWLGLTTRTGQQQQYNLSMSGGSQQTQIYMSGGYFKQEGSNIGADLKRISGNVKVNHTINQKLSVATNLSLSHVYQNTPLSGSGYYGNPLYVSLTLRPTQNPYNSDGTLNISNTNLGFPTHYNPLYTAAHDKIWLKNLQAIGGGSLEYKVLTGLKFTSHIGIQYNNMEEFTFKNAYHGDGKSYNGYSYNVYTRYFLWDWYNQLDYHFDILRDKKFSADVKVGYEAIKSNMYRETAEAQNYPPTEELTYSTNAATALTGASTGSDYTFGSVYANLALNYQNKYAVTGSFRRDASSRFSEANQAGNFPSVGLTWNVNEEEFMQNVNFFSLLKLRASYGSSGNAEIGNYGWRKTFGYGANYNGVAGGTFNSIGNSDLTWEKNKQLNIGIDLGILNDRIHIVADYYRKVSDGLLFSDPLPPSVGFSSVSRNIGKMENKGLEFTIDATPVKVKDFSWNVAFNIANNKNKMLTLPGGTDIANGSFRLRQGRDIYSFYLKSSAGVDPATGSQLWYTDSFKTATTTNYSTAGYMFLNKSALPKVFGSFSNTFNYKGFYFTADLYYNFGNYVQDSYGSYFLDAYYPTRGKYTQNLKRWQKAGDVTSVPKYVYGQANTAAGERLLYKGDYIRLRNVVLGYKLTSSKILKMAHLTSLHFYARGTNLWTKTYDDNLTFDPEQGVASQNAQGLLISKSLTFGLNVGF
ncbi:MAG: SusC/RagA family TonB-linked outer membrane protein [Chitinophagaceae bacterium]